MTDLGDSPLGHATTWSEHYDPRLLFRVERAPLRAELGVAPPLPFRGVDLWTAYELSWLGPDGIPEIAVGSFSIPAESPRLVESKSLKLYLTALNLSRFATLADVRAALERDLGAATGAAVGVTLRAPDAPAILEAGELEGASIDRHAAIAIDEAPVAERLHASGSPTKRTVYTRLFRSVCPVTGQPDYASVQLRYEGASIDEASLLAYLLSYRRHPGFHEHCVERIFCDVWKRCAPKYLAVYARFTRRGGIDINPWRTSGTEAPPENRRTARQ